MLRFLSRTLDILRREYNRKVKLAKERNSTIKETKPCGIESPRQKIRKEQTLDDMLEMSVWMASESENREKSCTDFVSAMYPEQILYRSYREDCSAAVANEISAI